MALRYTYRAGGFDDRNEYRWYVRFSNGAFQFCAVLPSKPQFDVAQGSVDATDIPENVRNAALERAGSFPSYVRWK